MPAEDEAAGAVLAVGCPSLHADAASHHRSPRALHDGVYRLVLDAALNHSSGELLLLLLVGSGTSRHVTGRRRRTRLDGRHAVQIGEIVYTDQVGVYHAPHTLVGYWARSIFTFFFLFFFVFCFLFFLFSFLFPFLLCFFFFLFKIEKFKFKNSSNSKTFKFEK
jgi:hypothetical protein